MRRPHGNVLHAQQAAARRLGRCCSARVGGQVARCDAQNPIKLISKACLEHGVDFVNHYLPHVAKVDAALGEELEQPAWRRDQQIDRVLELPLLRPLGDSAVHHRHAQPRTLPDTPAYFLHLQRELTRRQQHERTRPAWQRARADRFLVGLQSLHDRHKVSERLSRTSLRTEQEISAARERGHRLYLHCVGLRDTHLSERFADVGAHAQLMKVACNASGAGRARRAVSAACMQRDRV
mmetsp:Transcript_20861/g.48077  ORF Transcript_20861/g.48077 Transcript_20861/m.48077 type:complete len:237 (-) Transcript_20861:117-827(-)